MTFLVKGRKASLILVLAAGMMGCGSSLSISLDPGSTELVQEDVIETDDRVPTECFQQDVIETDCYTRERVITDCVEDFFGILHCTDTLVIDEICEDVVVDSFLICE